MNYAQAAVAVDSTPARGTGYDFYLNRHGAIAVLVPVTPEGQDWVDANLAADVLHWAGGVIIEKTALPEVLEGIRGDGLVYGGGF